MMIAKCKYSPEFYPLLMEWFNSDLTQDKQEFKTKVQEFFQGDTEAIINDFFEGVDYSTPSISLEIEEVFKNGDVKQDYDTIRDFFGLNVDLYNQTILKTKRDLVKVAIYNFTSGEFVHPNDIIGSTDILNDNIRKYKIELLNILCSYLNKDIITDGTDLELNELCKQILSLFENNGWNFNSSNENEINAIKAYATLKFFDQIISEHVSFIKQQLQIEDQFVNKKYKYIGPHITNFSQVFGANEHADADSSFNDLSEILLNIFPEVDVQNNDIANTSIGKNAFKSFMTKLHGWMMTTNNEDVKNELNKSVYADMQKVINIYIQSLNHGLVPEEYRISNLDKLRGIGKYMFSPQMDAAIKAMFIHLMNKTVPAAYVSYESVYNPKIGCNELKVIDLLERPIKMQQIFINDVVEAASYFWKGKNLHEELKKVGFNISFSENQIILKNNNCQIIFTKSPKGIITQSTGNTETFDAVIGHILQWNPDEKFNDVASIVNKKFNKVNLIGPLVASVLFNASNSTIKLNFGQVKDLAKVLSRISGGEVLSVIKNIEDNNLPLYQLVSLAYRLQDVKTKIDADIYSDDRDSIYTYNIVYNNTENFWSPRLRTDFSHKGTYSYQQSDGSEIVTSVDKSLSATKVNEYDLMHVAFIGDFISGIVGARSLYDGANATNGIIYIQPHCFSDKSRHFMIPVNLDANWTLSKYENGVYTTNNVNLYQILQNLLTTGNVELLSPIYDAIYASRKYSIETTVENILNDYRRAGYELEGNDIREQWKSLKTLLEKSNIQDIRNNFYKQRIDFIEELHVSNGTVNNNIDSILRQVQSFEIFKLYLSDQLSEFVQEFEHSWNTISQDRNLRNSLNNKIFRKWFSGKNPQLMSDDGELNPLVLAYYLTDVLISNQYNEFMIGNSYNHKIKYKNSIDKIYANLVEKEYILKYHDSDSKPSFETFKSNLSEEDIMRLKAEAISLMDHEIAAARWIAQVKRMVIYGATYHSYAQGMDYGVPEIVKMAVLPDIGVEVRNILGMSQSVDSMDGSGITSPYLARWQNHSLIDAAGGLSKKTIYHDIGGIYGNPKLLKWAEFALTNFSRRLHGDIDAEKLYYKMHSLKFNDSVDIQYSEDFDNLYYREQETNIYWKISKIEIHGQNAIVYKQRCLNNGSILSSTINKTEIVIQNIADIDSLFGGAFCMQKSEQGDLEFSEIQNEYVNSIICENNLKDYLIGWLVNTSAIKVGAVNLNDKSVWTDDNELHYCLMSTKFGGVQMDADHELDHADVTEASQMISALVQMGYTKDKAQDVYIEIGKYVVKNLQTINFAISDNKLYELFGKALIQSFASGDKETLGLAQSFIKLANKSLAEGDFNYRIPLSSSSINGLFNSAVTVELIRKAIRRHYDGVGAVLNPSHGMIQIFNIDGKNYTYDELAKLIDNDPRYEYNISAAADENGTMYVDLRKHRWSLNDLINLVYKDGNLNPTIQPIQQSDIDFEDTIVIFDSNKQYKIVKIDSYEKYQYYKNVLDTNYYSIYNWTFKPKNLKGSDTIFYSNGIKYSMYDHPLSQTLYWINNTSFSTWDSIYTEVNDLTKNFGPEYANYIYELLTTTLTQYGLEKTNNPIEFEKQLKVVKRRISKQLQNVLNKLSTGTILWGNNTLVLDQDAEGNFNYKVTAAQVIMGKSWAKQFGLTKNDTIANIKAKGPKFFEKRLRSAHKSFNSDEQSYDILLTDGSGKKLHVKLNKNIDSLMANTTKSYKYKERNGSIYLNGRELCTSEGKIFLTYEDSTGAKHDLVLVNSLDSIQELINSGEFNVISYNYTESNLKYLSKFSNVETDSIDELKMLENKRIQQIIKQLSIDKFNAFEDSLKLVAVRIPCQSQQSFAPMEIIAWSDSEINEIYIPAMISWLEGSDYDIDKQYIMRLSVFDNGTIPTENFGNDYVKDLANKNRILKGVWSIITDPKNQINLTQPVTTDRVKVIAEQSTLGQQAKRMSPDKPSSRYMMQIQNMVGRDVIGNVATAIKSFFALTYFYNKKFDEIALLIQESLSGNDRWDEVRAYLRKYAEKPLANVNMDAFNNLYIYIDGTRIWNQNIPEDIIQVLETNMIFQESLDDVSMLLGELLNCATDNAKELILKKINADQTWSDIYTSSLIFGEDLEELGQLMIDRQELIENYQKSLFSDQQSYGIVSYLSRNEETVLLEKAKVASEIKILGKILKINQGLPTNIVDFTFYVKSIEEFISKKFGENFDLVRFLSDDQYREICINTYEQNKDVINILEVISEVPHFREMLQSIVLNQKILSSLSVRNALFFRLSINAEKSKLKDIWNKLDETLINQWIYSSNISITIPANALKNPAEYPLTLRESKDLDKFREYMETYIIPRLKLHPKTKDNLFIKNLVLGMKKGTPFYKLNLDMIHIDTTEKTQKLYDSILSDFNKLNTSRISGVPMNLIDAFYLYNLIVNKDKFGPNNLTRVFEDILVQPGNENLFIHKFNSWIDTQNVDELYVKLYPEFKEFEKKQKPNSKSVEKSSKTESSESQHLSSRVEIHQGYWTRAEVESQTDKVFLFGDNTDDRVNTHYIPSRTQAVIRGLPNAIGIDTKKNRGISENSYFTDADFDIFKAQVDEAIQRAIDSGKTIVIPADGIGTGKAELDKRAPKLFAYLQQKLNELKQGVNKSKTLQSFNTEENISEIVIVPANQTAQKAKELGGIDTLRHPDSNGMHFGNPFSHKDLPGVKKVFATVKEAVDAFQKWLLGEDYYDIEPERRQWIINQLISGKLKGKPIVYYTSKIPDNSYGVLEYDGEHPSHAHILQKWINEDVVEYLMPAARPVILDDYFRPIISSNSLMNFITDITNLANAYYNGYYNYYATIPYSEFKHTLDVFNISPFKYDSWLSALVELPKIELYNKKTKRYLTAEDYYKTLNLLSKYPQISEILVKMDPDADNILSLIELWDFTPQYFIDLLEKYGMTYRYDDSSQLIFNFEENDDPERFNTVDESIAVIESPKTILSNSELQLWSSVANSPKILVASEHSDPAFHTKKILEVINGTRSVIDWKGDSFTGNQFNGLYIITKHDGLPIRQLLETKIPKLIHFSITTLGGTKYEPGVMKYNDLLDRIAEYIKLGLDPNTITIRIDPIVPGVTNFDDVETVIRRSAEMGIKRIKFSIMDAYSNTMKAMTDLGYDFDPYYDLKNGTGSYKFHAKQTVQHEIATKMLNLSQKYNVELHTCAEPLALPGILHDGCLSVNAVNEMLGTTIEDKEYDNNKSRQLCSCFGGKIDVLRYGDYCASHCIYCYAKHENDKAMQYYNEDGTLKHNALTDVYWDEHKSDNSEQNTDSQLSIPSNTDTINETETIGIQVDVTLPGQPRRTYFVTPDEKIYNSNGDEVFATHSKNRNKILANYAVKQKIAVVVLDKTGKYVVYKDGKIVSVKSGDIVYEDPTHGIRKRLLVAANKQFVNNEVYDTSVPRKTELVEKLKYLQLPDVKMVTDGELMEQPWYIRNAFGFIKNGVIHINVDRASDTTVIHEFGHIYLGHARTHNSEQYYNLLKQVRDTQLYKELRNRPEYTNKQGSDYDEEILAIMLEEYFSNPNDENIIVEQLLQILDPEFVNFMNTGIVPRLNDSLIAEYAVSQKVATAKNKLIKDNQLIENCE